jgi:hypothetical protein
LHVAGQQQAAMVASVWRMHWCGAWLKIETGDQQSNVHHNQTNTMQSIFSIFKEIRRMIIRMGVETYADVGEKGKRSIM